MSEVSFTFIICHITMGISFRSRNTDQVKLAYVNFDESFFTGDQVHLNQHGCDKLADILFKSVQYVPKSVFDKPCLRVPSLSDSIEFPILSGKKIEPHHRQSRMPKFPKKSKQFRKLSPVSHPVPTHSGQLLSSVRSQYLPSLGRHVPARSHPPPSLNQQPSTWSHPLPVVTQPILTWRHPPPPDVSQPPPIGSHLPPFVSHPQPVVSHPPPVGCLSHPVGSHPAPDGSHPMPNASSEQPLPFTVGLLGSHNIPVPFKIIPAPFASTSVPPFPSQPSVNLSKTETVFSGPSLSSSVLPGARWPCPAPTRAGCTGRGKEQGFKIYHIHEDLFARKKAGSFCQSVSKDMEMKQGIATKFKTVFKALTSQKTRDIVNNKGVGGVAVIKEGDDFVYNLITKEKYKHRPVSPHDLDKSIRKMRNHARAKGVKRINMPKISSGRDGLKWDDVLRLLEGAFRHENICIWVYHSNPDVKNKSDTVNLDVEEENNDENETTIRALKKELHNANKIIEVMQSNLRSDDVIKTDGLSDKAASLLRSGQLTVSSLYSVLVNMEQELQSQKSVNDMLTMEMDEVKLNIPKLNGVEAEVKTLKVLLDEAMDEI